MWIQHLSPLLLLLAGTGQEELGVVEQAGQQLVTLLAAQLSGHISLQIFHACLKRTLLKIWQSVLLDCIKDLQFDMDISFEGHKTSRGL